MASTVNNITDAVGVYRDDAATLYVDAHDALGAETSGSNTDERKKAMAAAFSRLTTAETLLSAQQGRDGLASVVALMATIQTTASSLCGFLTTHAGNLDPVGANLAEQLQIMQSLSTALQALGDLAPTAVWHSPPPSGGTSG